MATCNASLSKQNTESSSQGEVSRFTLAETTSTLSGSVGCGRLWQVHALR